MSAEVIVVTSVVREHAACRSFGRHSECRVAWLAFAERLPLRFAFVRSVELSTVLLSMTGYGEARSKPDGKSAWVEVRTINGRYFKLSVKCFEGYNSLEPEIEHGRSPADSPRLGASDVARRPAPHGRREAASTGRSSRVIARQLQRAVSTRGKSTSHSLRVLLALPGVAVEQPLSRTELAEDWPLIEDDARGGAGESGRACAQGRGGDGGRPGRELPPGQPRADSRSRPARRWWPRLSQPAQRTPAKDAGTIPDHARPGGPDQRGQHLRRAFATSPRRPSACEATWNNSISCSARLRVGTKIRIPDAGNVPRSQHNRLEGERRHDLAACDRDQGRHRANSRDDSKRRVRRTAPSCRRTRLRASELMRPRDRANW